MDKGKLIKLVVAGVLLLVAVVVYIMNTRAPAPPSDGGAANVAADALSGSPGSIKPGG